MLLIQHLIAMQDLEEARSGEESARKNYRRFLPLMLRGQSVHGLLDSGNSWHSCISEECAKKLRLKPESLLPVHDKVGVAAGKQQLQIMGQAPRPLPLQMGGSNTQLNFQPMVVRGLRTDVNISGPFLRHYGIDQIHSEGVVRFQGQTFQLLARPPEGTVQETAVSALYVDSTVVIPPWQARAVPVRAPAVEDGSMNPGDGLVEGSLEFMAKTDLHPWMHALRTVGQSGKMTVGALNTTDEAITLKAGVRYGDFTKACKSEHREYQPWHVSILSEEGEEAQVAEMERQQRQSDEEEGTESEEEKLEWITEAYRLKESPFLKTPELVRQAALFLRSYWRILGKEGGFGKTSLLKHEIHLTPGPPIKCRHRPINPALEPQLREQLDQWLKTDVIEPSKSPWSFALVAAPKKNGKIRWCVDFRRLNDRTIADTFPLPQVEDNLVRMAESFVFSTVDGSGAFHVVEMRKRDREKTAFSTPWGLFHFKRMPFGLCNGPATYCRLVQMVLQGIPTYQAIPYLDDTIVHSADVPGHFQALKRVLDAFAQANLKLQPEKCFLFQNQVEYLGHLVTGEGLKPVPKYVQLVKDWPLPTTKTEARAFLGKVGYYRRFIKGYSAIAAPWTDVTGKNPEEDDKAPLQVTAEMKQAFENLKEKLTTAPILAYPNFNSDEPFIVDTDWSHNNNAVGAVLSQVQDGQERVICYGGKKLSKSQRNYGATKGELAGLIYFLRHWRYYLQHRHFIVRTDHQPLQHLHNLEPQEAMVHRWLDTLASFDFTIKYRKGTSHGNADAMSRAPHLEDCNEERPAPATDEEDGRVQALVPLLRHRWDLDSLQENQQRDEAISPLLKAKRSGRRIGQEEKNSLSAEAQELIDLEEHIDLGEDGLLYYRSPNPEGLQVRHLLILPEEMREEVLRVAHESSGHKGVEVTFSALKKFVFFPRMKREVAGFVAACRACQARTGRPPDQRHTYAARIDGFPFQRISIDLVGPLRRSRNGNTYILTCRDTFSRWLEAFPVSNITTKTIARTLEREVFCRYGLPDSVHSDQGSQFTSQFFEELTSLLGIRATNTPAYNPKSNPVERAHRDLKGILSALLMDDSHDSWEDLLPQAVFSMNVAVCEATGLAPYQILFGRDASTPLDHLFAPPPEVAPAEPRKHHEYLQKLRNRINQAHHYARKKIGETVIRRRRRYHAQRKSFEEGEKVWLFTPVTKKDQIRKFAHHWTGPWTVVAPLGPVMVRIADPGWNLPSRNLVVSIDRLKLFRPPPNLDLKAFRPHDPNFDFTQDDDPFLEHVRGERPPLPPEEVPPDHPPGDRASRAGHSDDSSDDGGLDDGPERGGDQPPGPGRPPLVEDDRPPGHRRPALPVRPLWDGQARSDGPRRPRQPLRLPLHRQEEEQGAAGPPERAQGEPVLHDADEDEALRGRAPPGPALGHEALLRHQHGAQGRPLPPLPGLPGVRAAGHDRPVRGERGEGRGVRRRREGPHPREEQGQEQREEEQEWGPQNLRRSTRVRRRPRRYEE